MTKRVQEYTMNTELSHNMCQSAYLLICSSGGVPATSALGSEGVLSAGTPADAVGEIAAVGG